MGCPNCESEDFDCDLDYIRKLLICYCPNCEYEWEEESTPDGYVIKQ